MLYIAFMDFVKAFDTVNRELLFIILRKLGCPPKFIRIIKKLYTDVHARLIVDGELTQSLEYNSGVKQGCKLAPTLFGIYAEVLLWLAFKKIKHTCSVQIRLPYNGDLFDLRRLKAKTKALTEFICMLMTLLFSATRQRVCNRFWPPIMTSLRKWACTSTQSKQRLCVW